MDRTHNPEFTVMELYVAYKDYFWMMETTENLLETISYAIHKKQKFMLETKKLTLKLLILEFQFLKLSKNIRELIFLKWMKKNYERQQQN